MVKKIFLISILFIFVSPIKAKITNASNAIFLDKSAYRFDLASNSFNTTAYFDADGNESAMTSETSFSMTDISMKLAYGYSENLEFNLGLIARYLTTTYSSGGTDYDKTKMGLESGFIGGKYYLGEVSKIRYAVGGGYRQTLYTNSKYDPPSSPPRDQVSLGDDGSEYRLDFYGTYLGSEFRFDTLISYVSPPNNLSQEINYKLEGVYWPASFGFVLGVNGIKSLNKDPYANDPSLKPQIALGGTSLFNSTNRELMAPYVGINYDFQKFNFESKVGTVSSGVSTDKGIFFIFAINFGSKGQSKESVKVETFKEYTIDGSVLKVSARGTFIKIDQGLSTDVEKGMAFDVYQTDYFGGNVLVASGVAYEVGSDWSIIKLTKKYKEIEIKPGFAARGK